MACILTEDTLQNEASYCNENVDFSLGDLEDECECTAYMDLSSGDVEVTNSNSGGLDTDGMPFPCSVYETHKTHACLFPRPCLSFPPCL